MDVRGVDQAAVERIARMEDPVARNRWITLAYHDLARRLDALYGGEVTWCGFAVWASRTAGDSITGDAFPGALQQLLAADPHYDGALVAVARRHRWIGWLRSTRLLDHVGVLRAAEDVTARISGAIAAGNQLVFAELAPLYVAFLEHLEADVPVARAGGRAPDLAGAARAVEGRLAVRADLPDPASVRAAFTAYGEAVVATGQRRAELVLAANLGAVAHEQQRLQPAVAEALDAAIDVGLLAVVLDDLPRPLRPPVRWLLSAPVEVLEGVVRPVWERAATETLMRFDTADESLHLTRELPPLPGAPDPTAPLTAPEALAQWTRWCTGPRAAASDWAVLAERMNFIAHLFRTRQRHVPLLDPPYDEAELAALGGTAA